MKVVARKHAKAVRSQAFLRNGSQASTKMSNHLEEFLIKRSEINTIAVYMPIQTEIDTLPAIAKLRLLKKVLCLPLIVSSKSPLNFLIWNENINLVEDKFRVLVPEFGELTEPDLLLCPLLSFDTRGYRLGYGGGFYDRTIDYLKKRKQIFTMGCAFAEQMTLDNLPIGKYDKPLDSVVTEYGVTFFAN